MFGRLGQVDEAIIARVAQPLINRLTAEPKEVGKSLFLGCLAIYLCGVFFQYQQGMLAPIEVGKAGVLIVLTLVNLPLLSVMSSRAARLGLWRVVRMGCLFLACCRLFSIFAVQGSVEIVVSGISLFLLVAALYASACDRPPPRRRRVLLWRQAAGAA